MKIHTVLPYTSNTARTPSAAGRLRFGMRVMAAFFLASLAPMVSGQIPNTLLYSVPPPAGVQSGTQTGYAVATDGVRTVVGSPQDDTAASNAGVVRVYDSVTGALQFVLPNPTPASGDSFGAAVAISGARVVVAAINDDLGANDAGAVHVFDLSSPTPATPVVTLGSPGPQGGENFGISISLSDTMLVVGAYDYDTTFANTGRAWVYDLTSATPSVPVRTLDKPNAAASDKFGHTTAIFGRRVVVGSMYDDSSGLDSGRVYVFDMASPTPEAPVHTLNNPAPNSGDNFGSRVALTGSVLAVAAERDDAGATDAGIVYLYDLNGATPTTPIITVNNPSPAASDHFGSSLSISGNSLIVGCSADNQGAVDAGSAYIYHVTGTSATLVFSLANPTPAVNDRFGISVSISGSTAVVGAHLSDDVALDSGAAYFYHLSGNTPTTPAQVVNDPGPSLTDEFGSSTAVSGTYMAVGAPSNDTDGSNCGMVYVYDLASGTPDVPVLTIHNPTPAVDDQFGYTLSLSGSLLAVTSYQDDTAGAQAGAVYVYDLAGPAPTVPAFTLLEPVPSPSFGFAMDISGTRVVVGANFNDTNATDAGAAYVFDLASATPTVPAFTLYNPNPAAEDRFGRAVAISGTRVVIGVYLDDTGATNTGCAYVYDLVPGTPAQPMPTVTILNPTPAGSDWFARAVSISGSRVVIGAALDNTGGDDVGSAYVYDVAGATPAIPIATLNNPEPGADDNFGSSLDISGTRVLVGAYIDDVGAVDSGSAYLYDLTSNTPLVPVAIIRNPTPAAQDQFANNVSIDGALFAVGTPLDDTLANNKGYVHVYGLAPEIVVEHPQSTRLTDGSPTPVSFGGFKFGATSPARVFTVRNTGATNLLNLAVAKGGTHAADFTVDTSSLGTFIAPGANATFSVTLNPATPGLKTATLQIASTDLEENPFDIALGGQAYSATTDTDSDGMNDWQEFRLSALGFNWQTPNVDLVNTYFDTASENSLYTTSQVQDLNLGTPLLQRHPATGAFTLTFGVEKFTTQGAGSGTWVPFPMTAPQTSINEQGKLEFQFTVPNNAAFFRLQAR